MKKTYSIRCEEDIMKSIDETAKSLGLNRSSYLIFLATSIEGILGSQEHRAEQSKGIVNALSEISDLEIKM